MHTVHRRKESVGQLGLKTIRTRAAPPSISMQAGNKQHSRQYSAVLLLLLFFLLPFLGGGWVGGWGGGSRLFETHWSVTMQNTLHVGKHEVGVNLALSVPRHRLTVHLTSLCALSRW